MIQAIIFDFDGVILESADIKTQAFSELFADYPEKQKEIVSYHVRHGGISRFVKFNHIYRNILGHNLTKENETALGERFSHIVLEKVLRAPFVAGARELLEANGDTYRFFIASGRPEGERMDMVRSRGVDKYFREIHGSPKKKQDIIHDIMKRYRFLHEEVVYVGDAESDRIAADAAGVHYVERNRERVELSSSSYTVKDMSELGDIIETINKKT